MSTHRVIAPAPPAWRRTGTIVLVALLLRVVWAIAVPIDPVSDSVLYDAFAREIATGRGYRFPGAEPTVYWPVGTSAIYAGLYAVFGTSYGTIATFQVLIGTALVALVIGTARRLTGDDATAAIAGWFVAVWPVLVQFTSVMASELIFMTLLVAALRTWLARRLATVPRALLFGVLIAAATYVRPTAWPFLVLFPVLAAWIDGRPAERLAFFAVSVLAAAVCLGPWVARNHALFDRFVLVSANGGTNLWMGNNPEANGGYMALPERPFRDEVERDQVFGREAVDFIKSHPGRYLALSARRAVSSFDRESIGVAWNENALAERYGRAVLTPLKLASAAWWWAMLVLGAAGVVTVFRDGRARRAWPALVALGFLLVVPVLTVGGDRYHLPANPLLAMFAAVAVARFLGWRDGVVRA